MRYCGSGYGVLNLEKEKGQSICLSEGITLLSNIVWGGFCNSCDFSLESF